MYFLAKFKKIIKIIFINIVVLIILIIGIDTLLLNNRIKINRIIQYNNDLDIIIPKSNLNLIFKYDYYKVPFKEKGEKTYKIVTDKDGCRIGEKKTFGNNRDIVMLGDSFSFGSHADYDKTVAGILQNQLKNYHVWNFSVGGTCSSSYADILSYFIEKKKISPEILLVGLYVDMQIGDIPRILARKRFGSYKAIDGVPVSPSLYLTLHNSFFHKLLFNIEIYLRSKISTINILFPVKKSSEFSISLIDKLRNYNLNLLENMLLSNINSIKLKSKMAPQHIIIWFVPSNHELIHKVFKDHDKDEFFNLSKIFWDNCEMRLKTLGYQVVDPREKIEKMFFKDNIYPFTVDGHLNEYGFECISQMIIEEIDRMNRK